MTFAPVVPPVVLLAVAVAVVVLRAITMRQLASRTIHRWATVWRWSGLTLAMVLMLIAAARPAVGGDHNSAVPTPSGDTAPNVFFVVDRSPDSSVTDYDAGRPRMAGIRDDIVTLIDRYPGARFAMVTFASRPSLEWPLSEDGWSLKPVAAGLQAYPDGDAAGDVNAAGAANVLRYQLIAAGQRIPGARNIVFYFGSGAPGSTAPQGEFDPVPRSVDGGAVFGYGTAQNEPALRRIAGQLGVPYVARDSGRPVTDGAPETSGVAPLRDSGVAPDRTDLYWVFTMAAAVLMLFELYWSLREVRASRRSRRDLVP